MKGILFICLFFAYIASHAQATISFEKNIHDFGAIKEVDGPVSYNFVFTNTGNAPIIIKSVEPSCGCTLPEWTKQPVLPGKTGFVRAIFDPKDRPSYFDKSITVHSNAKNAIVELKIKGNVESRIRTVLDDYPYELASGIRLPFDHVSLMTAGKGEVKKVSVKVYNNAGKNVRVAFTQLPPHLKIQAEPSEIKIKGTTVFHVEYDTRTHGEFGLNEEDVQMSVDGKTYSLPVSIFIEEDFSQTNMSVAPAIQVDKRSHNFGTITKGQSTEAVYKITNTGKSALKIHRCYSNDKSVDLELKKNELAPGESTDLTAKIKNSASSGKISAMISIISNAPVNPETKIRFYGEIK